jgi:pimeloyl-ACP methyl ester carboxylesterase
LAREKRVDRVKAGEWRSRGDIPRSVHGWPFPGVLGLGGSDGGTPEYFPNLLVPEGFACLAIAYWGTSDTQSTMVEIPLERLERGLRWLIDCSDVMARNGRVAVVGASRGGELALLLATSFPDLVGPVVAYTPSSVVWFGLDFTQPAAATRSTWTRHGKPLPHLAVPAGRHASSVRTRRVDVAPFGGRAR